MGTLANSSMHSVIKNVCVAVFFALLCHCVCLHCSTGGDETLILSFPFFLLCLSQHMMKIPCEGYTR